MGGLAAIILLPIYAYCLAQLIRDARRRSWIMAAWGLATVAFMTWLLAAMTSGGQH